MIANPTDRRSKIVLGVDDETENLVLLKSLIEGAGYTFLGSISGDECLALVGRIQPRLILLDVQMFPGIDGFQTCERLRANPQIEGVPIVFLTGRKSVDDVKHCLRVGGNDFIVKPFDPARLVERVNYWIGRRVGRPQ